MTALGSTAPTSAAEVRWRPTPTITSSTTASSGRPRTWRRAGCSACTGGLGTYTYSYTTSSNAAGYNSWATKTVETLPDGNQNIVYTNAYGEVMLEVYQDASSGLSWDTFYQYDGEGHVILAADPSAVTGYNDSYADLLHNVSGTYQYLSNSSGLITLYDYYTTTTATETTAGGVAGYLQDVKIQQGQPGTPMPQETWQYFAHTACHRRRGLSAWRRDTVYRNTDGTGGRDHQLQPTPGSRARCRCSRPPSRCRSCRRPRTVRARPT